MKESIRRILGSSIFRKQVIAVTGLGMVVFVVFHLLGNLYIYGGPEAFNGYSEKLHALGPLLWVARFGLIGIFVVHVWLTISLARENRARRPRGYEGGAPKGDRNFATYTMMYTGILVAVFLVFHLNDFTFPAKTGPDTVVPAIDDTESQGLFGLVWNSYNASPVGLARVALYLAAVCGVGLHLSHAIQSVFQTFGFHHPRYTPVVKAVSVGIGGIVAFGFATIPLYALFMSKPIGV